MSMLGQRSCTPTGFSDSPEFICRRRDESPPPSHFTRSSEPGLTSPREFPSASPRAVAEDSSELPLPGIDSGSRFPSYGHPFMHGFPSDSLVTPQRPEAVVAYHSQFAQLLKSSNDAHRNESQPMTRLHDRLFIGGLLDEDSASFLHSQCGVTDIVNVVEQQHPTPPFVYEHFNVHNLRTEDRADYFIIDYAYPQFKKAVDTAICNGGIVYVHCYAGINRSVALCVAYLLEQYDWDLLDVVTHFHKCGRRYVLDNEGFQRQLVDFFMALQTSRRGVDIPPPSLEVE